MGLSHTQNTGEAVGAGWWRGTAGWLRCARSSTHEPSLHGPHGQVELLLGLQENLAVLRESH